VQARVLQLKQTSLRYLSMYKRVQSILVVVYALIVADQFKNNSKYLQRVIHDLQCQRLHGVCHSL
jgi:hypothetical protein